MFDNPAKVFDDAILKPETQDLVAFADGIRSITEAQQRVALEYFEDSSVEDACPPLQALLTIMAHGQLGRQDAHHPAVRAMFTREHLLASDWYRRRLATKQAKDVALWRRHVASLDEFLARDIYREEAQRLGVHGRRSLAAAELERAASPGYVDSLVGTLGADPSLCEGDAR